MSRTKRRVKGRTPEWAYSELVEVVPYCWEYVPLTGVAKKKALAKYHADYSTGYGWNGNAPKDFRKSLDRIKRAKEKATVCKMMVTGEYDNYTFDPRKNDAGWYYW